MIIGGAAAPAEDVVVVEDDAVGGSRGGEEGRLVAAHASRARRGWGVGTAALLRHVERRVCQLGREIIVPLQEGIQ